MNVLNALLILIILVGCIAAYLRRPKAKQFPIYWNMPTTPCNQFGYDFTSVPWKFVKNQNNGFRGDRISLFYSPGSFPRIDVNADGKLIVRNNGLPQTGNLTLHLTALSNQINKLIPDVNNNGLAILDMEDWYPRWKLNTGSKDIYRNQSRELVKRRNPNYKTWHVEKEAIETFHENAEKFLVHTLRAAKAQRPNAIWGYYELPYCDNYVLSNGTMPCSFDVRVENEKYLYIYKEMDALYPSIYLYKSSNESIRARHITGRIEEAYRLLHLMKLSKPVYPYANPTLTRSDPLRYLSRDDLMYALIIPKVCGTDGVVLWGSSSWFNSAEKCAAFNKYLRDTMGPVVDYVADCTIEDAKKWLHNKGERTNICL